MSECNKTHETGITGKKADLLIIDDPIKNTQEAEERVRGLVQFAELITGDELHGEGSWARNIEQALANYWGNQP